MGTEDPTSSPPSYNDLSTIQQKAVDRAFEQLFGYSWGTRFDLNEPQTNQERLLCRILGKRAAASILRHRSQRVLRAEGVLHQHSPHQPRKRTRTEPLATEPPNETAPSTSTMTNTVASRPVDGTMAVSEVVRTPAVPLPPAAGGVDAVLQALQDGQNVTTIAKTSADWEVFKEQTGLGEKLEEKAEGKDAYLNRQAFLTRVDHRTFELERQDRDRERAKRGK